MTLLVATLAAMLFSTAAIAQDAVFAPRTAIAPKAKKAGARGASPRGTLDKNLVKAVKRKAVPFKKITVEMINARLAKANKGARGQAKVVKLGDRIPVGKKGARGAQKTVSTEEYVDELNKLAEKFAAQGLDPFADGPDEVEVGAIDMEPRAIQAQRTSYRRSMKPIESLRVPQAPAYLKVRAKRGARGAKKYTAGRLLSGAPEYTVDKKAGKARSGARGSSPKPGEKYEKKIEKSWGPYGSKKTAAVEIKAGVRIFANDKKVELSAHGGAYAYLFKKKKTIFAAKALLYGDSTTDGGKRAKGGRHTGKAVAKLTVTVLGKEKVVFEKEGAGISFEKEKSFGDDFSYTIRFAIGPVPCSVEVGAAFKVGVRFQLLLTPVKVSAAVIPFINADAFARFAVDIVVLAAGIEGRVTLLDAEAKIHGEAGLAGDSNGLYVYAFFAGDLGLEALSGTISAFVKVNWCIFACSKTYKLKIFSWKGLKKQWRLFKLESPRFYLIGKAPKGAGTSSPSAGVPEYKDVSVKDRKVDMKGGKGKGAKKGKKKKSAKKAARQKKRAQKKAQKAAKKKAKAKAKAKKNAKKNAQKRAKAKKKAKIKACKKRCGKPGLGKKGRKARKCRKRCK